MGIALTVVGLILIIYTFFITLDLLRTYMKPSLGGEFISTLSTLLTAAIQAMFLGIMGWVSSILITRGVDFMRVDRGVGMVTFRLDRETGLVTGPEPLSEAEKQQAQSKPR